MTIKISVIIPVYNAEQFIAECIESLLSQTLKECEFIFINDGSTDKSMEVIKAFQAYDDRIRLINQDNQGVSIARNKGVEQAVGEYIGFVDADDYIESDMYETLYNLAKKDNSDVLISNFKSDLGRHKMVTTYPFPVDRTLKKEYIQKEIIPYFLKEDNLNTACNKIYKTKIIKQNNIIFPERVALGEDGMFNLHIFNNIKTTKYTNYTGYHYREVCGSATRNIAQKDYFARAIEVYKLALPEILIGNMDNQK